MDTLKPLTASGQHFCTDPIIIQAIVKAAHLEKEDIVLEIGAGTGLLTKALAKNVKKVIAIDNDLRLKPFLKELPDNVEVIFADALPLLQKKVYTKIVANIPYQLAEPLLHFLCQKKIPATLTVPASFAKKTQSHPLFSAFLKINLVADVPRAAFSPPPRTDSCIITVFPITKPTPEQFFLQQLWKQKDKKLKNGLREAIIDLHYHQTQKIMPKRAAQEQIKELLLTEKTLDTLIARLPPAIFAQIVDKLSVA